MMRIGKIVLPVFLSFFFIFYGANMVLAMSGRNVFKTKGCINCHTVKGSGGNAGPDLSDIGYRKRIAWIEGFIKNPDNYYSAGSSAYINGKEYIIMMPPFKNMLSAAQLNAVAGYLESLK